MHHGALVRGGFKRYQGVWRRALNVLRQAGPRNVWMCSAWPCSPSPTSAWREAAVMPKYGHCCLGQAKPAVFTRLGAPRRLLTSRQGRTGAGTGPPPDEGGEARRQVGQSRGVRGLRRRWAILAAGNEVHGKSTQEGETGSRGIVKRVGEWAELSTTEWGSTTFST